MHSASEQSMIAGHERPRRPKRRRLLFLVLAALAMSLTLSACGGEAQVGSTEISISADGEQTQTASTPGQQFSSGLELVLLLTIITLVPTLLLMMTAFTRIIIVLGFIRTALGVPQLPPNQVLLGLALFMTIFIMAPVWTEINEEAIQPLQSGEITQREALDRGADPLREFMFEQTRERDIALFMQMGQLDRPNSEADVPTWVLIPAYVISELKTAFQMGFLIFIPFLIIDLIVSSTLMSMGMMMLPPVIVSLPFKILLFVMVDGWDLIVKSLVTSFG
ncbi:MAG: flagellar type III secretion system pore protein FliP [Thermomicrobiales bacterium]